MMQMTILDKTVLIIFSIVFLAFIFLYPALWLFWLYNYAIASLSYVAGSALFPLTLSGYARWHMSMLQKLFSRSGFGLLLSMGAIYFGAGFWGIFI